MRKQERELSKKRKALKKQQRKGKLPITVTVQLDCGCCHAELEFDTIEAAHEAFNSEGLTMQGKITDDRGNTISNIDTFYGFAISKEDITEMKEQPLLRLAKRVGL